MIAREGLYSLVDEVEVTSINDTLSCVREKSDRIFEVLVIITTLLVKEVDKTTKNLWEL